MTCWLAKYLQHEVTHSASCFADSEDNTHSHGIREQQLRCCHDDERFCEDVPREEADCSRGLDANIPRGVSRMNGGVRRGT